MASIVPESRALEHTKSFPGTHFIIKYSGVLDLFLRLNLFVTTFAPVLLIATSKQTVFLNIIGTSVSSKFTQAPALIYAISALSLACLHSIITTFLSFLALRKQAARSTNFLFCIFVMDLILLGIVASVAGAAGEVSYIGLRGNKSARWQKICEAFDTYCLHIGFANLITAFAGITLIFLIILSVFSLISTKINNG